MFKVVSDEASKIREIFEFGNNKDVKKLLALSEDPEVPDEIRSLIIATRSMHEESDRGGIYTTGRRILPKPTLDQLDKIQK